MPRSTNLEQRCWRVFYTLPRAEKKCEARPAAAGFDSYLFARVSERERFGVLQDAGIVACLRLDGRLVTVSDEEMEQLQRTQQHRAGLEVVALPGLRKGGFCAGRVWSAPGPTQCHRGAAGRPVRWSLCPNVLPF